MKIIMLLVIILLSMSSYSQQNIYKPGSNMIIGMNKSNSIGYMVYDKEGKLREVNSMYFGKTLKFLFEDTRETVCSFPVTPSSVTASIGVASVTWEKKELCKGYKKRKK